MTQYSTAQKLCLAGMVLGAVLIAVGGCAPYWIITDVEGFGLLGDLLNDVVSASMGPLAYCTQMLGQTKCALLPWNSEGKIPIHGANNAPFTSLGWLRLVRITTSVCVAVGVLCGISALCLACGRCCQRLIPLGLLAFGAAVCGVCSAVVWSRHTEDFTQQILGFQLFSWGWAFFVFCAGLGLLGLVSFIACFASPENSNGVHGGMVLQPTGHQLTIISPSASPPPNLYGASHPYSVPDGVPVVGPAPVIGAGSNY